MVLSYVKALALGYHVHVINRDRFCNLRMNHMQPIGPRHSNWLIAARTSVFSFSGVIPPRRALTLTGDDIRVLFRSYVNNDRGYLDLIRMAFLGLAR